MRLPDQGVFKLTQAMGGGKTHNLLAYGLLARHPELRSPVMGDFHTPAADLDTVRLVALLGPGERCTLRCLGCHRDAARQA